MIEILTKVPEAEYHSWDMMSASALKTLDKATPMHLLAEREEKTDTPAFRIGRALHSLVLTPAAFDADFVVAPDIDKRTTAGKAEFAKFSEVAAGRTILSKDESQLVDAMRDGIMRNKTARQLLTACVGSTELTLRGDWDGVPCKARIDGWSEAHGTIIDVKTHTGLASPQDFSKSAHMFGYWTQFAFYREMLRKAGKEVSSVILIVVEKTAPHGCLCTAMYPDHLDLAASRLPELVDLYRKYMEDPTAGWPDTINEIRMPAWALTDLIVTPS